MKENIRLEPWMADAALSGKDCNLHLLEANNLDGTA